MTGLTSSHLVHTLRSVLIPLAISLASGFFVEVAAQFLVINDCNGFTRAVEQVGNEVRNVQFDVSGVQGGDVSGARISLTNNTTGEVRFAAARGGKVSFGSVSPGIYTVATEEAGLILGAIKFSPLALLGVTGSALVGGAVVGGGITGVVLGVDAIINATDGDPGSSPIPTPVPTPEPTPDECSVCDPDASPPPLDEGDFADALEQTAHLSPAQ